MRAFVAREHPYLTPRTGRGVGGVTLVQGKLGTKYTEIPQLWDVELVGGVLENATWGAVMVCVYIFIDWT
jgi:hypothetical protein